MNNYQSSLKMTVYPISSVNILSVLGGDLLLNDLENYSFYLFVKAPFCMRKLMAQMLFLN